ncbi:glycosyl hydrolase family 28 protein [Burkholderia sp. Ac-20365]|uniref:glycoside hydrolase family 28 protein n=1 Tax=Burkholderia sp. Ac-20365 TaxID=2703897 RepID=UPI00197C92FB|nr:glycosyl hydrolase family 28 protein [Burkholderia sp. Ac-20365]MBN3764006.1 glycoside hydrolase [Burkholderia sp. Ac-20365]
METQTHRDISLSVARVRLKRASCFATLVATLMLGACGGSSQTQADASGATQNNQGSGAASSDGASEAAATPAQPASAAEPASGASDVVAAGFQVGTTTFDSALPPEPTLPSDAQICATLPATLTAQPNGLLPDSADAADTAPDTTRIQTALTACTNAASTGLASNKAVRLVKGSAGANAFLAGALNLPSGVTLWIDQGVTLFASRDPRQFDKTRGTASCGLITASDNGCNALINASKTSNSAVVGDGTIDGRGGSQLVSSVPNDPNLLKRADGSAMSWWDIGWEANVVQNKAQNNPRLIQISNGRNFMLYRVTLQNAPKFHVVPSGVEGFTAWGVKIYTPTAAYEAMTNYKGAAYSTLNAKNTDGIDPASSGVITSNPGNPGKLAGDVSNVLIAYTSIRTGDDNIAIKGGTAPVNGRTYNITVAHSHFYEGHGMSIGSETAGTDNGATNADVTPVGGVYPSVSNVSVYDLTIDGADNGLRIKSDWSRGGLISNIRYANVCIRTAAQTASLTPQALIFSPYYSPTKNGGLYPNLQGISLDGVRIVNASSYTFQGFNSASAVLLGAGWSAGTVGLPAPAVVNPLLISLNNVTADVAPLAPMSVADAQFSIGAGGTSLPLQPANGVSIARATPASVAPVDCSQAFVPFPLN